MAVSLTTATVGTTKPKILIVDDQSRNLDVLEAMLGDAECEFVRATSADEALLCMVRHEFAVLILDIMMPGMSGIELATLIKQRKRTQHVPVLMLTAKGEEIDRVVGFEVGADDYVVKPFSVREVMLRVRALLRRQQRDEAEGSEVAFGRLRLDSGGHRAWVDDQEAVLTALEFRLLTTLLTRRGRVQTRERLLQDVWGIEADVTTRTVDTHVKRLRQKLGGAGEYIETLRGVGYRFKESPTGNGA